MQPTITSLQNPKIKNLVKLRQRRQRDQQKRMLIDGSRAIGLALENNFELEAVYFRVELAEREADLIAQLSQAHIALHPVTDQVFQKIGYGNVPAGLLAVAPQPRFDLNNLPASPQSLYLIMEGIEKPGNLGAILRSADAVGLTGLIFCHTQTDVYNPNIIRTSRGAFFTVPIAWVKFELLPPWLQEKQLQIVAATPQTTSQVYTQVDLRLPTAFVLGAEHAGLSETWLQYPQIHIPMVGQVDSLNVAQTASILMYEALRQRSNDE